MHKNIIDLTNQRFGNLTVIGLTDLKTEKKRCAVWECLCDCGNTCYKTGADLRDTRRKTWSCGCMNKGNRKFPNKYVPKNTNAISELSEKYSVIELLTAAIMHNNKLDEETANIIAEQMNSSDYIFDRLVNDMMEEIR